MEGLQPGIEVAEQKRNIVLLILKEIKTGFRQKYLLLSMTLIEVLGLLFWFMLMVKKDIFWHPWK